MARCAKAAESPAVDDRHTAAADGDHHTDAAGTERHKSGARMPEKKG
jgi:hypothetical protein